MGLLSSAYHMSKLAERYFPVVKKWAEKAMDRYVNTIEPEEWTDKVANVDISDMDYQEKQEKMELAVQTADLMEGKCDNLAQAIQEDPVTWGAYLDSKGMNADKVAELKEQVAQGEEISSLEVVKLAIGGGTPAGQEKQAEEEKTQVAEAGTTERESIQAEAEGLGDIVSGAESSMEFE